MKAGGKANGKANTDRHNLLQQLDVLRGTRYLLRDERRWVRCSDVKPRRDGTLGFCLGGALDMEAAVLDVPLSELVEVYDRVSRAIARRALINYRPNIRAWNDRRTTTHRDVLAALGDAAKSLAAQIAVERSFAEQGVLVDVTDPDVLRQVVTLIGVSRIGASQ